MKKKKAKVPDPLFHTLEANTSEKPEIVITAQYKDIEYRLSGGKHPKTDHKMHELPQPPVTTSSPTTTENHETLAQEITIFGERTVAGLEDIEKRIGELTRDWKKDCILKVNQLQSGIKNPNFRIDKLEEALISERFGRIRDLDEHIAELRNVKVPYDPKNPYYLDRRIERLQKKIKDLDTEMDRNWQKGIGLERLDKRAAGNVSLRADSKTE